MNKLIIIKQRAFLVGFLLLISCFVIPPFHCIAQTGIVGSLGGEMNVSPMGTASYSIPIEVVPGTCGVQPNLSITYNSASGRGLLGVGWDLSGLSSITRVPRDSYHDGAVGSVNFNLSDRLSLDGARLVKLSSGDYMATDAVYGTEVENFTRVTLKGIPNDTSQYFVAVTDQGQVIEYGRTSKSKLRLPQGGVVSWLVNKIIDGDGNYMNFYYDRVDSTGETTLKRISYTGNDTNGLTAYGHITFQYTSDPNFNKTYIGGNTVTTSKLLERIVVRYGSDTIRQYCFGYDFDRSTRLTDVILQDAEGNELTRTMVKWSEDDDETSFRIINGLGQNGICVGDFNADNYPDLFLHSIQNNLWSWSVRTGDAQGNFNTSSWSGTVTGCAGFFTVDLEGDGKDEICYIAAHDSNNDSYDLKAIRFLPNGHATKTIANNETSKFLLGDFLGAGGIQPVRISEPSGTYKTITLDTMNVSFTVSRNSVLSVTDLNGNGKSDIQVVVNDHVYVYEYDEQTHCFASLVNFNLLPDNPTQGYHGDFNGDGMRDYIYFTYAGGVGLWHLKISKGNDYKPTESLPFNTTHGNQITPSFPLLISDVNGDGKDDVIQPTSTYNGPLVLNVYYSRVYDSDNLFFDTIQIRHSGITDYYDSDYLFADLNHDGKNELFYTGAISQSPVVVSLPERREHNLVASVTNGLGKTTSLEYQYYNSPCFGFLGVDGKRIHYPCVSSMRTPDGVGGTRTTTFSYGEALFDYARKQFLGFGYHMTYCNGTNIKLKFKYNSTWHYLNLEQTLTYYHESSRDEPCGYISDTSYWRQSNSLFYHYETYNTLAYQALNYGRFIPHNSISSNVNRLENTKEMTYCWLNGEGRIVKTSTVHLKAKTVNGINPWISRDSTEYTYTTVTLPNGKTAVKPTSVKTWNRRNGYNQLPFFHTTYTYSSGRLATKTMSDSDGTIGTISYTYNSFGLPVTETYTPNGLTARTKTYGYDNKGRFLIQETNALGHTRSATFSKYTGTMTSETDVNNLTTQYQYDAFGRLIRIVRPDHTMHQISYHWYNGSDFGNAVFYSKETEAGAPEARTYYDILDRVIHSYCEGQGYSDNVYDAKGRVSKKTFVPYDNPSENPSTKVWHNFSYDNYDRLLGENCPYTNLSYTYYDESDPTQHDYFVLVTDNIRNTQQIKTYDALGRLTVAEDCGGKIRYDYGFETVSGMTRDVTTISLEGIATIVVSDLRGNRLSIQDPDAGTVTSTYNTLNQLISRTDANGNETSYSYDLAGRTTRMVYSNLTDNEVVIFTYDNAQGKGVGQLASVQHETSLECEYVYDTLGRLASRTVYDGPTGYEHLYEYDTLGRLQYLTYPDGFRTKTVYNRYGEFWYILDAADNSLVYSVSRRNGFRQPLKCRFGDDLGTQYTYNSYGMLTEIRTGDVTLSGAIVNSGGWMNEDDDNYTIGGQYQRLAYTYNSRGFIYTKSDSNTSQSETYYYDDLDRLTSYKVNGVTAASFSYSDNGNISSNSKVGTYSYGITKPHAVTAIEGYPRSASPSICDVTYNLRNRPETIYKDGYNIALDYDASGIRRHTVITNGQTLVKEKTHISDLYELEATPTSSRRLDYIYAEGRIVAVRVGNGNTGSLYYVLTDHLGSWEKVLDEDKTVVQQTHFDPWGNRMSYTAWNTSQTQTTFTFDRGFTGHEHYDFMHVINANARLYDPTIGRFFSPDPFVQAPDFTQAYNRYSYCMNNPVMYSDPTGEVFGIDDLIAAAVLGAIFNSFTQIVAGNVNNVGDFFLAAGIGALSGVAGLAVGSGINAAIAGGSFASGFVGSATVSSTGFWAGAGTGAASGFASGFISGTGNSLLAGNSFGQSLQDGWKEGLMGLGSGVVIGGICGGVDAYLNNKNPWTGKPPYYEASLDNYSIVYQSDDMNCKNAVLESIERMNGGTRTQADFKELGDLYLKQHPKATLEQYFEYFGFTVKDPAGRGYRFIGNLMEAGCPTVIEENIAGGHTLTIYRIRQWTESGKINVWLADPARGIWKTRWKTIVNPKFNHGLYTFILSL